MWRKRSLHDTWQMDVDYCTLGIKTVNCVFYTYDVGLKSFEGVCWSAKEHEEHIHKLTTARANVQFTISGTLERVSACVRAFL
jgi:hypothetical protein